MALKGVTSRFDVNYKTEIVKESLRPCVRVIITSVVFPSVREPGQGLDCLSHLGLSKAPGSLWTYSVLLV